MTDWFWRHFVLRGSVVATGHTRFGKTNAGNASLPREAALCSCRSSHLVSYPAVSGQECSGVWVKRRMAGTPALQTTYRVGVAAFGKCAMQYSSHRVPRE